MEIAFCNREFRPKNSIGLFSDIDWDTSLNPVRISSFGQILWIEKRHIRLYNVKFMSVAAKEIEHVLKTSGKLLNTIDVTECDHNVVLDDILSLISTNVNLGLKELNCGNCDRINTISSLTNGCKAIQILNLQSCYKISNTDCEIIGKGLLISHFH